jgi:hypothetical protein
MMVRVPLAAWSRIRRSRSLEALVDSRLCADRSRFTEIPKERFFVIQSPTAV